jgi:phage/plasmid primase-like uncharacterized protein/KaiC/GvpD/RAD55 family RecA-like ATPase
MADLSKILGGPWSPPAEPPPLAPEVQFIEAIRKSGIDVPEQLILDGKIHRFRSGASAKSLSRSGWYVGHLDGIPCITFGCWRQDITQTVKADVGRKWTHLEEMAHVARVAAAKKQRDAEVERDRSVAASTVETIWSGGVAASPEHPYLKRKGVEPNGARVTGDGRLMLPLFSPDGELSSLQYIDESGGKLYHSGGQTGGMYWMLGTLDQPGVLYIAEGFATAATIHEATNRPCIVAYSASNLVPTTGSLREQMPAQEIVIVADHDESGIGQRYAEQSAAKYGARMIVIPTPGDANDYAQAGNDLAMLLLPPTEDWLVPADDYCLQPAPIKWLVKRWIQDQALVMVHGPSGGGKTFVVLDWCLRIASGAPEWAGQKVKPGNVIYLAGEGHHGLRGRIAAWKHHNKSGPLQMWLSKAGCDLNTTEGYRKVTDSIKAIKTTPSVIVIDTLHRFLLGDENSAQDAKTMLDACANLMREFNCTVILVHHTGVSDEAQHRARGSSAWKGALDIEISIVPGKSGVPMQIVQRKTKDAELPNPVNAELRSVEIPGWLDEEQQPVTSAVVEIVEASVNPEKKDSNIGRHSKLLHNVWSETGKEQLNGKPYISRSGFIQYLMDKMELTDKSAQMYVKPSAKGKPICELLLGNIIEHALHGWVVVDNVQASAMLLSTLRKGA